MRMIWKKKWKKPITCAVLLMGLLLGSVNPMSVQGAESTTLSVSGVEEGDTVEIYRIASRIGQTGEYTWSSSVSNWLNNKSEANTYKELTPAKLGQMTPDRAREFCETLISSLKNESQGVVNLEGYSFVADGLAENYDTEVVPGYYIVLPKGRKRIYEIKWCKLEQGEQTTLTYSEENGDYQVPLVSAQIQKIGSTQDTEEPFLEEQDEILVKANLTVPKYPNMYATGKRIYNVTVVIPRGIQIQKESLTLSIEETGYSLATYENTTVYRNSQGERVFFETGNGYFYEINGGQLVVQGTLEEAIDKYNELHETTYQVYDPEEQNRDVSLETDEEETVLVVALDTELDISELSLEYKGTKDDKADNDCFFDNIVAVSYSLSPINANLVYTQTASVRAHSYGIKITVCEGTFDSVNMTPEKKLEKLPRLPGAEFYLYRLQSTEAGNTTDTQNTETDASETTVTEGTESLGGTEVYSDSDPVAPIQRYDEEAGQTYTYTFVKKLKVDGDGELYLAGLAPDEYLIIQQVYPEGYTRSDVSLLIESSDWQSEAIMEGNNLLEIVWLDYETVYLPGTGKTGIVWYAVIGTLLALVALALLISRWYPDLFKKILKNFKK